MKVLTKEEKVKYPKKYNCPDCDEPHNLWADWCHECGLCFGCCEKPCICLDD